jgi:predicted PurR-regulated permease PerM
MNPLDLVDRGTGILEKFGFPTMVALVLLVALIWGLYILAQQLVQGISDIRVKLTVMDNRFSNQVNSLNHLEVGQNALRSDLREVLIEMMRGNPSYDALAKFLTIRQPGVRDD